MPVRPPTILTWVNTLDLTPWTEQWPGGELTNPPYRAIRTSGGEIQAQVVVSEDATDDLTITEFPVENGAVINDHAFKRPAELRVQMGWTNAYVQTGGQFSDVRQVYEQILVLQSQRVPFQVFTGKRVYSNMLIASLRTHTDAKLEFTFMADIFFKEIVLTATAGVSLVETSIISYTGLFDLEKNNVEIDMGQKQTQIRSLTTGQAVSGGLDL